MIAPTAVSDLKLLLRGYPRWALVLIVFLGLLSYAFEGVSIGLFVPLVQTLGEAQLAPAGSHGVYGRITEILGPLSVEQRFGLIIAAIFGSILLKNVIAYGNAVLYALVHERITHGLRLSIVDQVLSLSQRYLEDRSSGQLMNTLATETWRAGQSLNTLMSLVISGCAALVFSLLLLLISWPLTFVVTACIAVIYGISGLAGRAVRRLSGEVVLANGALSEHIWELFGAMPLVRAFGREDDERRRFDGASRQVRDVFFRLAALSALSGPLHETLSTLLLFAIFAGAFLNDPSSLPWLVAYAVVLFRLQPRLRTLSTAWVELGGFLGAVREVAKFLDRRDKTYVRSGSVRFRKLAQGIRFERVTFRYRADDRPALDEVSFEIPRGRTTALVGPSGAGKSTIMNLICRFYDPDAGDIRVDGESLRQLDLSSWRQAIGTVSQDLYVFNTTIRDNIAYGRLEAGDAEIVEAARLAHAHAFISALPRGYETVVGERGLRLSGGQRQRIALARAILRDPQFLILDEATNALDSLAEQVVQETLQRFRHDRTLLVIAHRLSTVELADQIIVLDEGRVVERGDLRMLIEQRGLFSRLYWAQHGTAVGS